MTIEVLKPGILTTFQDAGRRGFAHLGIGRAGAFDEPAWRIANALCGNPRDACALEVTLLGPALRFADTTWVAVAGAPISLRVDGFGQPMWAPVRVPAGATLELGAMRAGCRSYVAVRGGFDVMPILGSRSMDVNAGLGPNGGKPLRAGDALQTGAETGPGSMSPTDSRVRNNAGAIEPDPVLSWRLDPRPWFPEDANKPLRLLPGKHLDRLSPASRNTLFSENFVVHSDSNRVALRLSGPALAWTSPIEMISEGCGPGLLQLPPSGHPIAFGPECPVSGGYPRIGQIAAVDFARLAQMRPGDAVRFTPCTFDDALDALRERERALDALTANIAARLTHELHRPQRGPR